MTVLHLRARNDGRHAMRAIAALCIAASLVLSPTASGAGAADDANAGMDALNAGQYAKAIQLFTRAIQSKKLAAADLESAYVERGKAYLGEHNTKLSLADFDRALKLNPGDQEASDLRDQAQGGTTATVSPARQQFDAGKAFWQAGDCASAEAQFQQGLALDPDDAAANFYYGDCVAKGGNQGGALGPLRLAVQYGEGTPEGQMAVDEVKRLAQFTSPMQGNDDGCAIPIVPMAPDGATATAHDIQDARHRLQVYLRASDRFQACVQDLLAGFQSQAQQNGYPDMDARLRRKLQGPVDTNEQYRQAVSTQFATALAAYSAAHPK
jgi:tetratricopeptide (TPR) repeat protein